MSNVSPRGDRRPDEFGEVRPEVRETVTDRDGVEVSRTTEISDSRGVTRVDQRREHVAEPVVERPSMLPAVLGGLIPGLLLGGLMGYALHPDDNDVVVRSTPTVTQTQTMSTVVPDEDKTKVVEETVTAPAETVTKPAETVTAPAPTVTRVQESTTTVTAAATSQGN